MKLPEKINNRESSSLSYLKGEKEINKDKDRPQSYKNLDELFFRHLKEVVKNAKNWVHKEQIKLKVKNYSQTEKAKNKRNLRQQERMKSDATYKLKNNVRKLISKYIY